MMSTDLFNNDIFADFPAGRWVVGFSGGVDSVVLLELLRRAGIPIAAAHLNHGIRGADADADADFCREFCQTRQIPFYEKRLDIPALARSARRNLEATARAARQRFFAELCEQRAFDGVILAHHADDQAETVFLRLLRGAGWRGLRGMRAQTVIAVTPGENSAGRNLRILRPLLAVSRARILSFAENQGLKWREDASNRDPHYTRNWLRNRFFPLLREIFPDYRERLANLSETATRENACRTARRIAARPEWGGFFFANFPAIPDASVLAHAVEDYAPRLRKSNFKELDALLRGEKAALNLPGNWTLRRENDGYFLFPPGGKKSPLWETRTFSRAPFTFKTPFFTLRATLTVLDGAIPERENRRVEYLDCAELHWPLSIRPAEAGESFIAFGSPSPRKIKDFCNDAAVPERQRGRLPLISDSEGILWFAPLRLAARAAIPPGGEKGEKIPALRLEFSLA